jgi:SPP1 gp7 family putative phage head morphogenesis protein
MRAIKTVASPIASVPVVFTEGGNAESLIEEESLNAFWKNPFLNLSYYDGIEATVGWLKLKGEAFWVADDSWLVPFPDMAQRSKLMIARPDKMRGIVENEAIIAWEYTTQKGKQHIFLPEQVWHHKFWNPYGSLRGLAEMSAAETAAEADYLAGQFKRNLMRSNGDRGVYVIAKNGQPDENQRKQIIEQIRSKQYANQKGEAKALFLSGDFSIEDPKIQAPDAAFHSGRLHDRHEVFIAFGVPASMADVQASYSIGSASDRFRLIEDTCMPLSCKIAEGIEYFAARQSQRPNLQAAYDWDEHSVVQEVRAERIASAEKLWSKGMPMNEVSQYLRLGLPRFPGDDVGYLPFNVMPVGSAEDPATDPNLAERQPPRRSKTFDEMVKALETQEGDAPTSPPQTKAEEEDEGEQFQKNRDKQELKLWNMHMRARRESVKRYESGFRRVLFEARKETLKNLDEKGDALKALSKAAAADFVFDLEVFRTAFFGAMRSAAEKAFMAGGSQVLAEISLDDPFDVPPEQVLLFIKQRENLLKNIPDDVHGRIMDGLTEGIQAGESKAKLSERVRATFNAIDSARANTIAQTETAAAYGSGRQRSMEQSGVTHKRWLTSGNTNVRPTHRAANGQTVKIDEDYEVGGEFLKHPCDPSGEPGETINCHCVSIAVKKED